MKRNTSKIAEKSCGSRRGRRRKVVVVTEGCSRGAGEGGVGGCRREAAEERHECIGVLSGQ